jgi:hypothetical protein
MQHPLRFWLITAPVLIAAGAFGLTMGHDDAIKDARQAAPEHSVAAVVCRDTSQESTVAPELMTPKFNGVYQGREAGNNLVVVRFYPNGTVYYAVGTPKASLTEAKGWVVPSYSKAHTNRTGPWRYDKNGAFTRTVPQGKGQPAVTNAYSVWKATDEHFNLHVESTFRCPDGETQGGTSYMTFVAD